jgi:hypothetical protein
MPSRFSKPGVLTRVLLSLLAVLAIGIALFDWI